MKHLYLIDRPGQPSLRFCADSRAHARRIYEQVLPWLDATWEGKNIKSFKPAWPEGVVTFATIRDIGPAPNDEEHA